MTVVTSLDEHVRYSRPQDRQFVESVNNGHYKQLELVDDDTAFVEPFELDNRRVVYDSGRFEMLAMVPIGVCLYALVIVALLHVIQAS